jgi:hypothetical protein
MKKSIVILFKIVVFSCFVFSAVDTEIWVRVRGWPANVRKTADIAGEIIGKVPIGTVLKVLGENGNWYMVYFPSDRVEPVKGYIHQNAVEKVEKRIAPVEKMSSRPVVSPALKKNEIPEVKEGALTPPAADVTKKESVLAIDPTESMKTEKTTGKFKKLSLRVFYLMRFSEDSANIVVSQIVYQEKAQYVVNYNVGKGNLLDTALEFRFVKSLGVEVGISFGTRTVNMNSTYSIPNPLLFNRPRTVTGNDSSEIKETDFYLNLDYHFDFGRLGFVFYAGPCYVTAKTSVISNLIATETYPFTQVSVASQKNDIAKKIFGFDAGVSLGFCIGNIFIIAADARYVSGKARFDTGSVFPGPEFKLGGFKVGGGIKIIF